MGLTSKGIFLTIGAMGMLVGGTVGVSAFQSYKENVQVEKDMFEKQQAIIQKEKEREKNLAKKYTGVHADYIDYAYDSQLISEMISKKKYTNDEKMVFLTFDNLTSEETANKVLNVLNDNNIKATFFMSGKIIENTMSTSKGIIENMYNSGHSIANRSYSDKYGTLFPGGRINKDNFLKEYSKTDKVLQEILGENFKTRVYRCPGGSMSWRGISDFKEDYANKAGLSIIDWNIAPTTKGKSGEEIAKTVIKNSESKDVAVVLVPKMDSEKMEEFLKTLIHWYSSNGYSFKSLG